MVWQLGTIGIGRTLLMPLLIADGCVVHCEAAGAYRSEGVLSPADGGSESASRDDPCPEATRGDFLDLRPTRASDDGCGVARTELKEDSWRAREGAGEGDVGAGRGDAPDSA